ncbi:MAG: acyltransferase [Bacteroidota bacterium]
MTTSSVETPPRVIKYNPQLDGLRFCAVLFVVCYHWLPIISSHKVSHFFGGFVNFFFVLSSYLITKILMSAKDKSVTLKFSKIKVILFFLFRRTIRIFPAYYMFLALVLIIPGIGHHLKQHEVAYFSYLANYYIFFAEQWPLATSHLWTLAVEEQFYIFWPLIVIFIPNKYLLKTFIGVGLISIVLRAIFYQSTTGFFPQSILTQYCLDSFAIGGILALKFTISKEQERLIDRFFHVSLLIGIPVGFIIILTNSFYLSFVFNGLIISVISYMLIKKAIFGYTGLLQKFLENKVVLFLGQISYSIYLYHLVVPVVFWKMFDLIYEHLNLIYPQFFIEHDNNIVLLVKIMSSQLGCFIIYSIITITLSILSWHIIEVPFNNLKNIFNPGLANKPKGS